MTTIFLDASTPALVRRYGDTKRRHPLLGEIGSVEGAIQEERLRLGAVRESADIVIDTSDLNVHDLRRRVVDLFGDGSRRDTTQVAVRMSFGYKYGVPPDVDLVFDCRFLPNPHWVEELRPMTGLDPEVQEYVASFDLTDRFLDRLYPLLDLLLPCLRRRGRVGADDRVRLHRWTPPRRCRWPSAPLRGSAARTWSRACGTGTCRSGAARRRDDDDTVVALGGGHGLAATLRAPRRTYTSGSPRWSRWPTTAGRRAGSAPRATVPLPATCASA